MEQNQEHSAGVVFGFLTGLIEMQGYKPEEAKGIALEELDAGPETINSVLEEHWGEQ